MDSTSSRHRLSARYESTPPSPSSHASTSIMSPIGLSRVSSATHLDPSSSSHLHLRPQSSEAGGDDQPDLFDPFSIDPELRLRTVRTAHSVIAESIRTEAATEKRRKTKKILSELRRRASTMTVKRRATSGTRSDSRLSTVAGSELGASVRATPQKIKIATPPSPERPQPDRKGKGKEKAATLPRRQVHVNIPLPPTALTAAGDPLIRYVRNKVRTSKYTIITFVPKNLFEQFRRVANIYFLALVVLQVFPIFGATNAQIGMLPLVFILGMTAIKDGIEDWRRAQLDDEVNNSATTKLGGWGNVNQPKDSRSFFERLLNLGSVPDRPSKGVRKLRDLEASAGKQIIQEWTKVIENDEELSEVILDKEAFPLETIPGVSATIDSNLQHPLDYFALRKTSSNPSLTSRRSAGVLDFSRPGLGQAQWERTLWKKLEVGDLVLLRDNEQVPADIIVLSTSHPDNLCFVETKNLDGETNLKVRKGLKATASVQSEEDVAHARFVVDSEPPHASLYTYNGVLKFTPVASELKVIHEQRQEAITINELLLRGCSLRNTKWIIGLVVFTGADTKIMLNGGETPSKRSKIERETNFNVIMNFLILIFLCLATAVLHGWYRSLTGTSADYYEIDAEAANNIYLDSLVIFASCLIVFQNIVPISLYITIEIVKTIQAYFIFQDIEMYYDVYNTTCVPKTWNISDDLGQIEYVFSDKTGTLTQNIMEFKKCSVQGVTFGEGMTEAMLGAAKREGKDIGFSMEDQDAQLALSKRKMLRTMKDLISNRYLRDDQLTLIAPELPARLTGPQDPLRTHLIDFFRALAICHSVLSDAPEPSQPFVLDYKAESPDEAALVAAARDVGFPFVARNNSRLDIEVLGRIETWTPLRVLEFNSSRKRMSVIVRDPKGRIVLFCKGADSVIYERLAGDHDKQLKAVTLGDLETFANGGLRTLCIAHRYLTEEEYIDWARHYDTASAAVIDREAEIERACELIEHGLTILGATALEDKLQEGVPDAIATLHQAGIKLWILTGDKLQTAIEIGYSCNLLTNDMEVMIISADSEIGARSQIEAGLNKMASVLGPPTSTPKGRKGTQPILNPTARFAVVIDGESLRYALQPSLKSLFLSLGTQCSAVICCRVSPSQKALTVRLVKEGCNAMTLSIGDGANDVAMIQEANVGVGLFGLEGSQAAMSADYAFGQFRFLTRLLLVHGRWSYVRVADMHANFFYKNIIWTLALFWFLIFNSFDGSYLFEYTFMLLYNLVFTSVPVGVLGFSDQDTNAAASLAFPQLYKRGIQGLEYTRARFWIYMADGVYQSAIIFFIPYLVYGDGPVWSTTGRDTGGIYDLGTTVAAAGVLAANVYIGINMRYWTFITWVVLIVSTLLVYLWVPIYSYMADLHFYGEVAVLYTNFDFWAIVVITVFLAVGPRWLVKAFKQSYMPKDKDIIREAWVAGDLKRQLGIHRRRDIGKSEADSSGLVDQIQSSLSGKRRGSYEPAMIASPQKEYQHSPLISPGQATPRSPMSYPPTSHSTLSPYLLSISPTPRSRSITPTPLYISQTSHSEGLSPPQSHIKVFDSPISQISYTSPQAIETFALANLEIKRLSRASIEIKRASMQAEDAQSPQPSAIRRSVTFGYIRPTRERHSSEESPSSRRSLPSSTGPGMTASPVVESDHHVGAGWDDLSASPYHNRWSDRAEEEEEAKMAERDPTGMRRDLSGGL